MEGMQNPRQKDMPGEVRALLRQRLRLPWLRSPIATTAIAISIHTLWQLTVLGFLKNGCSYLSGHSQES